jgi:hypothetical protein
VRKHVDAIALLLILLGFLAFSKAPDSRLARGVNRAATRIQNAIERIEMRHFRDIVRTSLPRLQ